MSILINGMEMPTYEQGDLVLRVRWDGRVDKDYSGNTVATAVPIPPHGDLVDLIAPFKAQYLDEMTEEWEEKMVTVGDVLYSCMVDEMPPITIPAEEVSKNV